jgi:hypothetical protein
MRDRLASAFACTSSFALTLAFVAFVVCGFASRAQANAPAPWAMCRGAKPGDPCDSRYYPRGRCLPQPSGSCPDEDVAASGGVCLYCASGEDTRLVHDATPAAVGLAGLGGLAALALIQRRRRRTNTSAPPS